MNYIIMDLEWNNAYMKSAQKFVNEIIEISAKTALSVIPVGGALIAGVWDSIKSAVFPTYVGLNLFPLICPLRGVTFAPH